jgi:excisionase family DNA binding protein
LKTPDETYVDECGLARMVTTMDPASTRDLWTVGETARYLQVSERSVRTWYATGQLSYVRIGRLIRIPAAAVRDFVSRGGGPPWKSGRPR